MGEPVPTQTAALKAIIESVYGEDHDEHYFSNLIAIIAPLVRTQVIAEAADAIRTHRRAGLSLIGHDRYVAGWHYGLETAVDVVAGLAGPQENTND